MQTRSGLVVGRVDSKQDGVNTYEFHFERQGASAAPFIVCSILFVCMVISVVLAYIPIFAFKTWLLLAALLSCYIWYKIVRAAIA